jgi:hypothetical protein
LQNRPSSAGQFRGLFTQMPLGPGLVQMSTVQNRPSAHCSGPVHWAATGKAANKLKHQANIGTAHARADDDLAILYSPLSPQAKHKLSQLYPTDLKRVRQQPQLALTARFDTQF